MGWRIGIDTGGTFTDFAAINDDTGETFVRKVSSTPANPADAIISALDSFSAGTGTPLTDVSILAHGTTVATNALIEGKGAKSGLLITKGFRAIYPARSGTRPTGADLLDPGYAKPELLVPLRRTFEIAERIGSDGAVRETLDPATVRMAARALREDAVEAVAICFLFSFLNDEHERRARDIFLEEYPDCRISLSSEVYPVIREYRRLSTVVLDAYVGPVVQRYLENLSARTRQRGIPQSRFFIMQSHGGLMRIDLASRYPNETLLSGPAAGITFARELGARLGEEHILTFDMGGTSSDISTIIRGEAAQTTGGQISGHDIGTPMIEIEALGAGGGAIAFVDMDGYLKVGPRSAGASPGPVCYGLGGTEPTVTDANLLLGYVDPATFAGGAMAADSALAGAALARLGQRLDLSAERAAAGVRKVVNSYMASGIRLHASKRGLDLRQFALLAFGGAGPLHAAEIGEELGVAKVIVPAHPGLTCAAGLLLSDVKHLYLQSHLVALDTAPLDQMERGFIELESRASADARAEGFAEQDTSLRRSVDLRYRHQGYELTIPLPGALNDEAARSSVRKAFHARHQEVFGLSAPGEEVEIVTLRLESRVEVGKAHLGGTPRQANGTDPAEVRTRPAYCPKRDRFVDTAILRRDTLPAGSRFEGPAIIEQYDSTILVGHGQSLYVTLQGDLVITWPHGDENGL